MVRGEEVAVVVPVKRSATGERVLGLPKGHPKGDETPEAAAFREVREETGLEVDLVEKLGDTRYSFERAGVISQGRGRLTVHDPAALRGYVY